MAIDLRGVQLSDASRASQDGVKARILLAARRPAEALPFYERAVEGYRKSADTANLLLLEAEYGEALGRLGRFRVARVLLERIVAARRERLVPAERRALWQLAVMHRLEGHPERAVPLLQEAVSFAPRMRVQSWTRRSSKWTSATSFSNQGRADDARVVLDEARATIGSEQGAMTPLLADALVALGRVHIAQAREAEALPLLDAAARFWTAFDADNPAGGEAVLWLGRCGRGTWSRRAGARNARPRRAVARRLAHSPGGRARAHSGS